MPSFKLSHKKIWSALKGVCPVMFQFAWYSEIILLIVPTYHVLVSTLEQSQSTWDGLLFDEARLADAP